MINPQPIIDRLEAEGWLIWHAGILGSMHKPPHLRDWNVRLVCPEAHVYRSGMPGPTGDYDPETWRSYAGANLADALQNALDDILASKQPEPSKPLGVLPVAPPALDLDFMLGLKKS